MQYKSGHEQDPLGFYPTLDSTIAPVLPYIPANTKFVEPAAGDYRLAAFLEKNGHECVFASDLCPRHDDVCKRDAAKHDFRNAGGQMFVTNLPYKDKLLFPILENLIPQLPMWMVIYSSWLDNVNTQRFMEHAALELPIGRARWEIPGKSDEENDGGGKRDFSWVMFTPEKTGGAVRLMRPAPDRKAKRKKKGAKE